MTCHIVPLDAVRVEVVEDGQAGLLRGGLLPGSSVVRLGQAGAVNGLSSNKMGLDGGRRISLIIVGDTDPPV